MNKPLWINDRTIAAYSTESPIERKMFWALMDVANRRARPMVGPEFGQLEDYASSPFEHEEILIVPQCRAASYRLDFAVFGKGLDGKSIIIGVECDGREFHKKPQQIKRDQMRDRFLTNLGVRMVRFDGWAIHKNAEDCATAALMPIMRAQQWPVSRAQHDWLDRELERRDELRWRNSCRRYQPTPDWLELELGDGYDCDGYTALEDAACTP